MIAQRRTAFILAMLALGGPPAMAGETDATARPRPAKVSVRVHGSPLHGANGIRFDAADRLHVASVFGREIVVIHPRSGFILDRYTNADGVETPDDLAFGPDGSLYWTAIGTGQIGKRSPEGVFSTVAQLSPGVNPITFSREGRLFVGLCLLGAGLFEVDPEGSSPPRSIREFPGEPCAANGFDIGPDGRLYAPRYFNGEVVRIDVDSGEMETVATDFGVPSAVKFDARKRLHVLDTARGELVRVDIATGRKRLVARMRPGGDNLAFDSKGNLFVSFYDDGSIQQVRRDGSLREVSPGGLAFPGGIAVVGDHFYVADHYALVEFNAATGRELDRQTSIPGVSELAEPMTVSAAGSELVLSSWLANAVQVWDPTHQRVTASFLDFNIPLNAISFDGGIAVAQLGSGNVVLERDGERSTLHGGLLVPTGLAADGAILYVADWAAGTITRVTSDGASIVAGGLVQPEGLAVTDDHQLLVVEAGAARVSQIDPASGERRVLAAGLALGLPAVPGFAPTHAFSGIALDSRGNAYVTGDVGNVVYVIARRGRVAAAEEPEPN